MINGLTEPKIVQWDNLHHLFEDYLLTNVCDVDSVVTGEVYEKLHNLYTSDKHLLTLPHHVVYNRIFYYIGDIFELLIDHPPERKSKFDEVYKRVSIAKVSWRLRKLMRLGGYVTNNDIQRTFSYRITEATKNRKLTPAFRVGNVKVWELELVGEILKSAKPRIPLSNIHVFGLMDKELLKTMGRCSEDSVKWMVNYLNSNEKEELRLLAKEEIDKLLKKYDGGLFKLAGNI